MNLRRHTRIKQAQLGFLFKDLFAFRRELARMARAPGPREMITDPWLQGCLERATDLAALVDDLPSPAPEFRCIKLNGGDIVDTFQTRSEALALVKKHAKQRKAKLQVLNSETGEVELFTEEELA